MNSLRTERLVIRNWEERDRDLFFRINSDDAVMRFFPFRRDREQSDRFFDEIRADVAADDIGFAAVEIVDTGACIGFCGLYRPRFEPFASQGSVEIGWRLAPEFWGKGYVTEAAKALLRTGFEDIGLEEIISFAVWNNIRSTAVMQRIGMRRDESRDFDHPSVPDSHPHLKRHAFYVLSRDEWRAAQGG